MNKEIIKQISKIIFDNTVITSDGCDKLAELIFDNLSQKYNIESK